MISGFDAALWAICARMRNLRFIMFHPSFTNKKPLQEVHVWLFGRGLQAYFAARHRQNKISFHASDLWIINVYIWLIVLRFQHTFQTFKVPQNRNLKGINPVRLIQDIVRGRKLRQVTPIFGSTLQHPNLHYSRLCHLLLLCHHHCYPSTSR